MLGCGVTVPIFVAYGLAQNAADGAVHGGSWLGLEGNGLSGLLFIAAGLLLLAAPLHWSAKGMSPIVGLALGAAGLIALASGHGAPECSRPTIGRSSYGMQPPCC